MLYSSEKSFCQSLWVVFGLLIFYLMFSGGCYSDVDKTDYVHYSSYTSSIISGEPCLEGERERVLRSLDYYIRNASVSCEDNTVVELEDTEEQIEEEIKEGEMEMLAQLIEAEAGNQDLIGKILVGDVVMNRVKKYGKSVEEIIFADGQFSCIEDGGFDRAAWYISNESFEAARRAYTGDGLDDEILSFTAGYYNPYFRPAYQYGDHYFGY